MSQATEQDQVTREVIVGSAAGLHARPAAIVVQAAGELDTVVKIAKGERGPVNARSILRVLSLRAEKGDTVVISAEGTGARAAVDHIADLVSRELDDGEEA